jgi:hypothetical protein
MRGHRGVILVDDKPARGTTDRDWYHMASDDLSERGLEELHAMADALGLRRRWLHNRPRLPHYDIPDYVKAHALRLGAAEVSTRELVTRCRRPG